MPRRRRSNYPYPYIQHEITRHKKMVWYFRRPNGPRIRLPDQYGTKEFWDAYHAAYDGEPVERQQHPKANSLQWLIDQYKASAHWAGLAEGTQEMRGRILKVVAETGGKLDIHNITRHEIQAGMDRRASTPHAANTYLKTIRQLFSWAEQRGYIDGNPAERVKRLSSATDGHEPWSVDDVERFHQKWPLGTRERVAMDLMLYTGLRRSDAVSVGPKDVEDGVIVLKTQKTGTPVYIPILDVLQKTLDAGPIGETFIIGIHGRPRKATSFGTWFANACDAAGVKPRAHGLRKAGAALAAENGATPHQLSALFGWTNTRMAEVYTRSADRKRLAKEASAKLVRPHPKESKGKETEE